MRSEAQIVAGSGAKLAGRYDVEALLGRGGMGSVYRVRDAATGRSLALKAATPARGELLRFRREFHTLASLRHPRIVEAHEYGIDEGRPYYTMELLDGDDLRALSPAPPRVVCTLLRDVALALAFLHSRRLIHRDLTPRNVRRTASGAAKLFDFGIVGTIGMVPTHVAGTIPFLAPETLRGMPLDHRVDLYGLGALAYQLLTGRNAYPARTAAELDELWRRGLPPLLAEAPGTPADLDALVRALLDLDPTARPSSAADVAHALTAIGGLEPLDEGELARGYVASAVLVGRQAELDRALGALARARRGKGGALVLEAPSGAGKSRLLREIGLRAQMADMVVLSASCEVTAGGSHALLRELARDLLSKRVAEAIDAARPRAAALSRVLPELAEHAPQSSGETSFGTDPSEARMRVQGALADWLLEVSRRVPLVLVVDDLQRSDEASAAVLAAVARRAPSARLLVVAALRTDEPPRSPETIGAIRAAAGRVRIRALSEAHIEELLRSMLGGAQHLSRLAAWLQRVAAGSPLLATTIVRSLIDSGAIRFVDGAWIVPEDCSSLVVPAGLADAMGARIAALSTGSLRAAEALSVHGGALSLELCVELAGVDGNDESVFGALDELVREDVLVGAEDEYRFVHDGVREALLRRLSADRRPSLHLRVARALEASDDAAARELEIGWHLMHGGKPAEAVQRLARAGTRLYEAQCFADAIAPLEAALEVLDRTDEREHPRAVVVDLRRMLFICGASCDRDVAMRHMSPTIDALWQSSGLAPAARGRTRIGVVARLAVGLAGALVRWMLTPSRRRGPSPIAALRGLVTTIGYAATVHAMSFELRELEARVRLLEPLAVFRRRLPYAVYLMTKSLVTYLFFEFDVVRRNLDVVIRIAERDRLTPIDERDRAFGIAGAYLVRALTYVVSQDPALYDDLAQIERRDIRYFEIGAEQARVGYHRLRGEEDLACEHERKLETLFLQLGSVWQMEAWPPLVSTFAYGLTRDLLGLKRTAETLARLSARGFRFAACLDLARGEHLRERGELDLAEQHLRRVIEADTYDAPGLVRLCAVVALAEVLLAKGRSDEAIELAREAAAVTGGVERGIPFHKARALCVIALARAARGEASEAKALLEDALREAAPLASPSICGALHEGCARVALVAGDAIACRHHALEMERWVKPTHNAALIGRARRLASSAESSAPPRPEVVLADAVTSESRPRRRHAAAERAHDEQWADLGESGDMSGSVTGALAEAGSPDRRAAVALDLLMQAGGASEGYLFFVRSDEGLELVAPLAGDEPSPDVIAEAEEALEDRTSDADAATVGSEDLRWRRVVLGVTRARERVIVAVAVLRHEHASSTAIEPSLAAAIARRLYDAGDVGTEASGPA